MIINNQKKTKERRSDKLDFVEKKIDFIHKFIKASNPATGSEVDSNANVTVKSIAVMEAELF